MSRVPGRFFSCALVVALLAGPAAHAEPGPVLITHNGRLFNSLDEPVEGPLELTFAFYEHQEPPAEGADEALWSETYQVTVFQGTYSTVLGDTRDGKEPLDASLFASGLTLYLGVTIAGGEELRPRFPMGTVPVAHHALSAGSLLPGTAVDANRLAIGGQPVIDQTGAWVGPGIDAARFGGELPEAFAKAAEITGLQAGVTSLETELAAQVTLDAQTYATKAELTAHATSSAETYATKDALASQGSSVAATYATKDALASQASSVAATYATKDALTSQASSVAATYATNDALASQATSAAATYATQTQLASQATFIEETYATKDALASQATFDAATYATKSQLEAQATSDAATYATQDALSAQAGFDAATYATRSQLEAQATSDAATYATQAALSAQATFDAETYATKDALASQATSAAATYATQTQLAAQATSDAETYATKAELTSTAGALQKPLSGVCPVGQYLRGFNAQGVPVCSIAACPGQQGDCDESVENGCETGLTTTTNCGACGVQCQAGGLCLEGGCSYLDSVLLGPTERLRINEWIGKNVDWTPCYRKSRDGGSTSTFHNNCDHKGEAFVVARLSNGLLIGAYTGIGWQARGYVHRDPEAFLFSLTRDHQYLPNGTDDELYDHPSYGPAFGTGYDLLLDVTGGTGGYCNPGKSFECRVGGFGYSTCRNDFCGTYNGWTVDELEVFVRP